MDRGDWRAAVHRGAKSQTQLSDLAHMHAYMGGEHNLENLLTLLEKAMAPHFSTLAWKIPWMEEPGRLQSMGSQGIGHD